MDTRIRTRPLTGMRASQSPGIRPFLCVCGLLISGCASASDQANGDDPLRTPDQQIAALEASIARDHRALEDLVTQIRTEETPALHEDETLRTIAERITREARLLESLRLARSEGLAQSEGLAESKALVEPDDPETRGAR